MKADLKARQCLDVPLMRSVRAQAVLEFTTAAVVFIMLAFGLIQILRWSPRALYEKMDKHDECMRDADLSLDCWGNFSMPAMNATMP